MQNTLQLTLALMFGLMNVDSIPTSREDALIKGREKILRAQNDHEAKKRHAYEHARGKMQKRETQSQSRLKTSLQKKK